MSRISGGAGNQLRQPLMGKVEVAMDMRLVVMVAMVMVMGREEEEEPAVL